MLSKITNLFLTDVPLRFKLAGEKCVKRCEKK